MNINTIDPMLLNRNRTNEYWRTNDILQIIQSELKYVYLAYVLIRGMYNFVYFCCYEPRPILVVTFFAILKFVSSLWDFHFSHGHIKLAARNFNFFHDFSQFSCNKYIAAHKICVASFQRSDLIILISTTDFWCL